MESEAKSEEVSLGDLLERAKRRCLKQVIDTREFEVAVAYSRAYASLSSSCDLTLARQLDRSLEQVQQFDKLGS